MGESVATAGDVDGDGYDDVIVGTPGYDGFEGIAVDSGEAYVWLGSSTGLGAFGTPTNADWYATNSEPGARMGTSVSTAGDVNGDGYSDVIIGAPYHDNLPVGWGAAFAWYGGSSIPGPIGTPANADWSFVETTQNSAAGFSVATSGDVNGDGFSDVVVGARYHSNGELHEGAAHFFLGTHSGLAVSPDSIVESDEPSMNLGISVATAGDVNGDGFSDVIVGSPGPDSGVGYLGKVHLYYGSGAGPSGTPAWQREGKQDDSHLGVSAASAGDVNGDGYSDVIVGASGYDGGETDEGRVFLHLGTADGLSFATEWTAESDRHWARFGASVACAGDVNGDGYSDVIVGAPNYVDVHTDEGAAFLWLGGSSGLGPDGSPANADWLEIGGQADAWYGHSVAAAGDVDSDGYGDIIVGAFKHSNPESHEGRACLYRGSASGPATTPSWTAESDQADAWFGYSVSTAGDVNGDGYSDVIVGAYLYDAPLANEGRAYVYHGSPNGLPVSPSWIAKGDQEHAWFGFSVSTAGDINATGYSDVIVGANRYENGQYDEGAAFLWFGSSSGLNLGANGNPANAIWSVEGDQADAQLGYSVSAAGDVNGDGHGEILVGTHSYGGSHFEEGKASLYFGTAIGPELTPRWTEDGDQFQAHFGAVVAPAGDVNGDGFSDILVGAPDRDSTYSDDGAVFLYLGNGGDGLDRAPQQIQRTLTAPIDLLGRIDEGSFVIQALGRSPAGRGGVRLAWEIGPVGLPLVGNDILHETSFQDTGPPLPGTGSTTVVTRTIGTPDPGVFHHWRARVQTNSPFFPGGPWLSPPGNGRHETDLRSAGCLDVDGDGYGAPPDSSCPQTEGDCDDSSADTYPGATQRCDGVNNDCLDPSWPLVPADEIDDDGDGLSECQGDCNDGDGSVWVTPSEVTSLILFHDSSTGITTLRWDPPVEPGTSIPDGVLYDTLRSDVPDDFVNPPQAVCTEFDDGKDMLSTDSKSPAPGGVFHYLIRAENACGYGPLGPDSLPRIGKDCP
jgi:hypothetical protein